VPHTPLPKSIPTTEMHTPETKRTGLLVRPVAKNKARCGPSGIILTVQLTEWNNQGQSNKVPADGLWSSLDWGSFYKHPYEN